MIISLIIHQCSDSPSLYPLLVKLLWILDADVLHIIFRLHHIRLTLMTIISNIRNSYCDALNIKTTRSISIVEIAALGLYHLRHFEGSTRYFSDSCYGQLVKLIFLMIPISLMTTRDIAFELDVRLLSSLLIDLVETLMCKWRTSFRRVISLIIILASTCPCREFLSSILHIGITRSQWLGNQWIWLGTRIWTRSWITFRPIFLIIIVWISIVNINDYFPLITTYIFCGLRRRLVILIVKEFIYATQEMLLGLVVRGTWNIFSSWWKAFVWL